MTPRAKNPIQATTKSLEVLDALAELGTVGVTELANYLGMDKGTVHHHLSTLENQEYVVKEDGRYELSLRFFQMGETVRRRWDIYDVGKPEVDTLAEETGELANLMVEEHGMGVYLHIAKGENAVTLDTKTGTTQYLHTSALGKAILAFCSESELEAILDTHGLPAKTPNTVTDRETLDEQLERIRNEGVAFDGEERAEGIRCVAAPILDTDDSLLGAVSVSGPATRLEGERFETEIPNMVRNTATIIKINVSYS